MIPNKYKVPKALWRKFTEAGQIAYYNVRSQARIEFMSHPKARISPEEWDTIAHNFACLAAFEVKYVTKPGKQK